MDDDKDGVVEALNAAPKADLQWLLKRRHLMFNLTRPELRLAARRARMLGENKLAEFFNKQAA